MVRTFCTTVRVSYRYLASTQAGNYISFRKEKAHLFDPQRVNICRNVRDDYMGALNVVSLRHTLLGPELFAFQSVTSKAMRDFPHRTTKIFAGPVVCVLKLTRRSVACGPLEFADRTYIGSTSTSTSAHTRVHEGCWAKAKICMTRAPPLQYMPVAV